MAHYAKVLDGRVIDVMAAEPEFFSSFVDTTPGSWVRYSYNVRGGVYFDPETNEPVADQSSVEWDDARLRKNCAGVGYAYDAIRDVFIPPQVYKSWVLNEATCLWEPPFPAPDDGLDYLWVEADHQEDPTQGWVQVTE